MGEGQAGATTAQQRSVHRSAATSTYKTTQLDNIDGPAPAEGLKDCTSLS